MIGVKQGSSRFGQTISESFATSLPLPPHPPPVCQLYHMYSRFLLKNKFSYLVTSTKIEVLVCAYKGRKLQNKPSPFLAQHNVYTG